MRPNDFDVRRLGEVSDSIVECTLELEYICLLRSRNFNSEQRVFRETNIREI